MTKPKLQLTRLIDNDLILSDTKIHSAMTEHALTFPDETDDLLALADEVAEFKEAIQSVVAAKNAVLLALTIRDKTRSTLEARLRRLGGKVQTIAQGNAGVIRSAGMSISHEPQPLHVTQVLNLKLKPSDRDAELLAWWKPVRGARYYRVQVCREAAPGNWLDHLTTTKAKCALNHTLISGEKVFVRVCTYGSGDDSKGAWSDIGWKTVP